MHRPTFRVICVAANRDVGGIVLLECGDCGGLVAQLSTEKHVHWHSSWSGERYGEVENASG